MRYSSFVIALLIVLCAAQLASAQGAPVVTIDANKNFCINGEPTFLIGTIGGDAYVWQQRLAPAGFNLCIPDGAATGDSGVWEMPDVLRDPSSVTGMKDYPSVLMWTLGYQIDTILRDPYKWPGATPIDILNKMEQCNALDVTPNRPVGVIWGNDTMNYGYEFAGKDGYWHSTRHFAQLTDFFVSGEQNVIEVQTITNSVRLSTKPVIAMYKCLASSTKPEYSPRPDQISASMWTAAICGAKGIILDRYASQDSEGNWYNWLSNLDPIYWDTIKKCASEISQLNDALTAPGPWMYYKAKPVEVDFPLLMYTHRMVGNDMYLMMVNIWHMTPISRDMFAPIMQADAKGEVLFDHLTTGVLTHPATSTTITDASKNWTPNEFAGDRLWIRYGSTGEERKYSIVSNTSNSITISDGDLVADGAQRYDYYYVNEMVGRSFNCQLPLGGRKVVKYENVSTYVTVPTPAEPVAKPSNRKWVELMDWSNSFPGAKRPADGYGLAYDANRHRLVCFGGLEYAWPDGKPNPTDADVWITPCVYEWDIDNNDYSGRLFESNPTVGDGWPGGTWYSDLVYHEARQSCMAFQQDGSLWEWRGMEQGWTQTPPTEPDRTDPGEMTHYAACYQPGAQRFLTYGGKDHDHPGMQYRAWQFAFEWVNQLFGFTDAGWFNFNNTTINLPYTPLEEPQMVWDTSRGVAVLFGCSHDGVRSQVTEPMKYYQEVPQQTYGISDSISCNKRNTSHVPYVFANYRMVYDPRSSSTLLFGGLPSKNGKITDLYEYDGSDWSRLDYDDSSLPAQDVRRTPNLAWDPDHQMVLFLDTRQQKIWGLTSGTEITAASIDEARSQSVGTSLVLEGMYVSRAFGGYFYMQDADRTTGIRVVSTTAPAIGQRVNVIGTLMQTVAGEKYLQAKTVGQTGSGTVEPLAMANSAVAGKATATRPGADDAWGANNTGVLVKVWGKVSYADASCAYIDDGSGLSDGSGHAGVKVQLNGVAAPAVGEYIAATGISATEKTGTSTARVVLLSRAEDLANY